VRVIIRPTERLGQLRVKTKIKVEIYPIIPNGPVTPPPPSMAPGPQAPDNSKI
jgi:hypothetical protein